MKRFLFVLLAAVCLFASCGRKAPQPVVETPEETEVFSVNPDTSIKAENVLPSEKADCGVFEKDGKSIGFEMRLRKTVELDKNLSNPDNLYYGVVDFEGKRSVIPMEQIRILPDIETGELVITLLLPDGVKFSGKSCVVSFYISQRDGAEGTAIFEATQNVAL